MFSPDFFCPNHHLFAQQIAKKKLKPREGELQPLPLALIPMLNLNVFCAHGTKALCGSPLMDIYNLMAILQSNAKWT